MKQRKVIVSVINDLVTDRRVHRTCGVLQSLGFEVLLVGRKRRKSPAMDSRPYAVKRMRLLFEKGPLFYACFNLRLFILLLFRRADLYYSNDLDTLLPNFLISRMKKKPLVYDAHEYFTGVPELTNGSFAWRTWKCLERWMLPRLKKMITVNDSIAHLYQEEYGIQTIVVRNMPVRVSSNEFALPRTNLGLPEEWKILILQGSGINIQRGAEEAVEAMLFIEGVMLLFVGDGDVIPQLKERVLQMNLSHKVKFISRVPMERLKMYTRVADGGLTLDKDTNINYRYSLPNKLFDYIQAGIPVLGTNLPEVRRIIDQYGVGLVVDSLQPEILAKAMRTFLFDENLRQTLQANLGKAAGELCWENERQTLESFINEIIPCSK